MLHMTSPELPSVIHPAKASLVTEWCASGFLTLRMLPLMYVRYYSVQDVRLCDVIELR